MNVLIIIIGLLTERYWMHGFPAKRFSWFMSYVVWQKNTSKKLVSILKKYKISFLAKLNADNIWFALFMIIAPLIIICGALLSMLSNVMFGFFRFVLELGLFCYLLGPENTFAAKSEATCKMPADEYLMAINQQIVAIVLYYAALGPIAALIYRIMYLVAEHNIFKGKTQHVSQILDWFPTRITAFLCMIVGNFQKSIGYFMKHALDKNTSNQIFLKQVFEHTQAPKLSEGEALKNAQKIVEYAFILALVVMALTSVLL